MTTQATKKPMKTLNIAGSDYHGATFQADIRKLKASPELITKLSQVAALHAVIHHNLSPLNELLDTQRLQSGELNKLGREIAAYVSANAPTIGYDKKAKKATKRKVGQKSALRIAFAHPGKQTEDGKRVLFDAIDEATGIAQPFAVTFDEWRNLEKATKAPASKSATRATTLTKALDKAMDEANIKGERADFEALATAARKLAMMMDEMAAAETQGYDEDALAMLANVKPGKSARANGKVAA